MAENSHISWTDHTFNPWIGCTKVSPGCAHCYAETRDKRHLIEPVDHWGKGAPRLRTKPANWRKPLLWNKAAAMCKCGQTTAGALHDCEFGRYTVDYRLKMKRARVFSASLADWLDDEIPIAWLADFLRLIHDTPNLDWMLLTKRPQNWLRRMGDAYAHLFGQGSPVIYWLEKWRDGTPPANVWIGTTVEDQTRADERIPALLQIPARVRFLSCEPLLGPAQIDWGFPQTDPVLLATMLTNPAEGINWVIAGGESGPGARPMHPAWPRSLRDQCAAAGVPFHFKQWGEYVSVSEVEGDGPHHKFPDGATVRRIGTKAAGRTLDNVLHDAFPVPV